MEWEECRMQSHFMLLLVLPSKLPYKPFHFPLEMCEYVNFPVTYTQHATTIQKMKKKKINVRTYKYMLPHDIAHSIHANASDIIYGAEICFSNLFLISFLVKYIREIWKWKRMKNKVRNGRNKFCLKQE